MKRILSVMLVIVFVMSLSACVRISNPEIQKPKDVFVNSTVGEESMLPNDSSAGNSNVSEIQITEPPTKQEATITETVLVDEAGVKITAKSLSTDGFVGPEIKLLIENNSGKNLTFQCRNASVNGYMIDTLMSVDVVNGKKANDTITFMESDLEACGIHTIADMEMSFHIFDSADWTDYLDTPQIQIKTSAAGTYEYTFDDSGDVAYDGNDVKIVVKGLSQDASVFGPSIVVYIENNSDEDITVQTRDVSINGFMVDAIFSSDIIAGKHAVDTITFFSSDLEENESSEIETAELSFHIFDLHNWNTITDSDVVVIIF